MSRYPSSSNDIITLTREQRETIRSIMKEMGYDQPHLAAEIGRSQPSVSNYLTSTVRITYGTAAAVYRALGKDGRLGFLDLPESAEPSNSARERHWRPVYTGYRSSLDIAFDKIPEERLPEFVFDISRIVKKYRGGDRKRPRKVREKDSSKVVAD